MVSHYQIGEERMSNSNKGLVSSTLSRPFNGSIECSHVGSSKVPLTAHTNAVSTYMSMMIFIFTVCMPVSLSLYQSEKFFQVLARQELSCLGWHASLSRVHSGKWTICINVSNKFDKANINFMLDLTHLKSRLNVKKSKTGLNCVIRFK